MPSSRDIPVEAEQNRLVVRMIDSLEQIEDARFPYLYFGPQEEDSPSTDDAVSPRDNEDD